MFFRDIIGHDGLKDQLRQSARSGRVPHAQLFAERKVSGALPMAIAFARYLQCQNRSEVDACGKCSSCTQMSALAHPDVHFSFPFISAGKEDNSENHLTAFRKLIKADPYADQDGLLHEYGASNKRMMISVAEASRILHIQSLKNFGSSYRVTIVWLADHLHLSAQNKLLKLLEEPQPGQVFLLICRKTESLLPTVVSRCQLLHFRSLPSDQIASLLKSVYTIDEQAAVAAAHFAEGDVAVANHMAHKDEDLLRFADFFVRWTRVCYAARFADVLDWCAEVAKLSRDELLAFFGFTASILEESLRLRYSGDDFAHPSFERSGFKMKTFASLLPTSGLDLVVAEIDKSSRALSQNVHARLLLFQLSMQLMRGFKM